MTNIVTYTVLKSDEVKKIEVLRNRDVTYSRHFFYYWSTQQVLPVKHPGIYQNFKMDTFLLGAIKGSLTRFH